MLNALDIVKWIILIAILAGLIAAFVTLGTAVISGSQGEYETVRTATESQGSYMVHDLWSDFWMRGYGGADDVWDWIQAAILSLGVVWLTILLWRFVSRILT